MSGSKHEVFRLVVAAFFPPYVIMAAHSVMQPMAFFTSCFGLWQRAW
jgi:hypothetical protein